MQGYIDVFDRKEKKYLLDEGQLSAVRAAMEGRLVPDEHGQTLVRSLYYDTPGWELIERSLDKPLYKEKLRLRVYGEAHDGSLAFVGIKKKFRGVVYKRRVAMSLPAAEAYLAGTPYVEACAAHPAEGVDTMAPKSLQISREVDFFMESHSPLKPSMLTTCRREAFVDPEGSGLRVTIDRDIKAASRTRTEGPASAAEKQSGPLRIDTLATDALTHPGQSVVEVKNAGPMPLWLTDALSKASAYPRSFSKYGTAYMKEKNRA